MHFVCSYALGYFPIYDDEGGHAQYDVEGVHGEHGTIGFR